MFLKTNVHAMGIVLLIMPVSFSLRIYYLSLRGNIRQSIIGFRVIWKHPLPLRIFANNLHSAYVVQYVHAKCIYCAFFLMTHANTV